MELINSFWDAFVALVEMDMMMPAFVSMFMYRDQKKKMTKRFWVTQITMDRLRQLGGGK